MTDNANPNDMTIIKILKIIRPDLTINEIRDHYFNHIINLAAKAFLFEKKTDTFEMTVDSIDDSVSFKFETMRKTQEV
jgi:hypothetical protein